MIYIREIIMPLEEGGFTSEDKQKNFNVYINYLRSDEQKKATLEHELNHIRGGDFNRIGEPVELIELENEARTAAEKNIFEQFQDDEILYLGYCDLPLDIAKIIKDYER